MRLPDRLLTDGRQWERGWHGPHLRLSWCLPLIAFYVATGLSDAADGAEWALGAAGAVGLAAGAAWQLCARRDLVDRLVWPALLTAVGLVLLGFGGEPEPTAEVGCVTLAGTVAGLVLTEAWLRGRSGAGATSAA